MTTDVLVTVQVPQAASRAMVLPVLQAPWFLQYPSPPDTRIEANFVPNTENFSSTLSFQMSCKRESGWNTFMVHHKATVHTKPPSTPASFLLLSFHRQCMVRILSAKPTELAYISPLGFNHMIRPYCNEPVALKGGGGGGGKRCCFICFTPHHRC